MRWIFVIVGVFAAVATAMPAQTAATQGCPVPPGAINVALPSGLPAALRQKIGDIALPGQPFNPLDIYVKGRPNRRYIFVWTIGSRWIVATEVGGIALRGEVDTYGLGPDRNTAALIDNRVTFPGNVCALATRLAAR